MKPGERLHLPNIEGQSDDVVLTGQTLPSNPKHSLPLLVLDLDETLVHGTEMVMPGLEQIAEIESIRIYARPFLREFLTEMQPLFRLAVWSASGSEYVDEVKRALFDSHYELEFIWSGERCTPDRFTDDGFVRGKKDLRKLKKAGYDLSQVVFVDNKPENLSKNYGNLIIIPDFEGDPTDQVLPKLGEYLREFLIAGHADFRRVEKRGWYKGPV